MMQPDHDLTAQFRHAVSEPRLLAYARDYDDGHACAVCRYVWNTSLCEALYPSMHGVEVAFRNIVDRRMCDKHGEFWFDDPAILIVPHHDKAVGRARQQVLKRGEQPTHNRLVAELGFGFWTGMLSHPYERPVWVKDGLGLDFPGVPKHLRKRSHLAWRMNSLRSLRNLASHHASIWKRPSLREEYERIVETLSWLSPALLAAVSHVDRFPDVLDGGPATHAALIADLFVPEPAE